MVSGPWFMTMIFDVDIYLQRCVYSEHSSLCLAPSRSRPSIVLEQKKTNIVVLCKKCLFPLKSTFSTLICFKLFLVFAIIVDTFTMMIYFYPNTVFRKIAVVLYIFFLRVGNIGLLNTMIKCINKKFVLGFKSRT